MLIIIDLYSLFEAADPSREDGSGTVGVLHGKKVLLAEDTAFFRAVECEYLESLGCEVDMAVDGVKAWEMIQKKNYDILVTDIEMPNMNGIDLTKRVRNSPKLKDLPVVALTSLIMEKDRERIIACGVNAYEAKLDKEHLIVTLKELLDVK